jgi:hypothetical protein
MPGNQYQYQPQFCLNATHLWSMAPIKTVMADYVKMRSRQTGTKTASAKCAL